MSLNETKLRNATSRPKNYKLTDSHSFYVLVHTNGSKYFRYDYKLDGVRKTKSLGSYPDINLKEARELLNEFKASLKQLRLSPEPPPNPHTFKQLAELWLSDKQKNLQPVTFGKTLALFTNYIYPALATKLIHEISSKQIYQLLQPLIALGKVETAQRIRAAISSVFDYAIVHDIVKFNPAQAVAKQIPTKKVIHRAAMIEPREVGKLLRAIYDYKGSLVVTTALKISMLTFQRPGEIRSMLWADIDLIAKMWRFYVSKTSINHIVPLSRQAVALLEAIKPATGYGLYVFPSQRNDGRPLSENGTRTALRAMGYANEDLTPHGFRTIASTLLNELGYPIDAIERQLSHMPRDKVRAAYNRAQYLPERQKMMNEWADYLDTLRNN